MFAWKGDAGGHRQEMAAHTVMTNNSFIYSAGLTSTRTRMRSPGL